MSALPTFAIAMALEQFFYENPNPCWIYVCKTLRFIEVNKKCLSVYGYTEDEFLQKLCITDLQPVKDARFLREYLTYDARFGDSGVWRHMNKAGTIFHVRIFTQPTHLNGQRCMYVMATNIENEVLLGRRFRANYFDANKLQNKMFIDDTNRLHSVNTARGQSKEASKQNYRIINISPATRI